MTERVLRALVVDDEPIARGLLIEEISRSQAVLVIGEAADGLQAIERIESLRPDIVFLDVQMPVCDGFCVLAQLKGPLPRAIIFVTAYDQYAIRAFEHGAADYLVKPVRSERFQQALERARHLCHSPAEAAQRVAGVVDSVQISPNKQPSKIVGRKGQDYFLLDLAEVDLFRAEGEIVWIFAGEKKYMATETLRNIEKRLAGTPFRRVHRSALVNAERVRRISSISSQRWLLTLANSQEVIASKRLGAAVRELIRN
jgi:DNA-binding LytR/AlgR family response regulator